MRDLKEIERSIIKTYRKGLWAKFIKAIDEFKLLKPNDAVCVCISGGKDSMILAKLFQELHRHSKFEFTLKFMVMNPGYNEANLNLIKDNLKLLNIDAYIEETNIFSVATSQDENPCYLCARMRRGHLYRIAKSLGCNKIALGHHFDDVIETTLMNMLNSGSFQTMVPKIHSLNFEGMELIRPLYFVREKDIKLWCKHNDLHFINCACKFTEMESKQEIKSQRAETKKLIKELLSYNELVEQNIYKATTNVNLNMLLGYKQNGKYYAFVDEYEKYTKELKENNDE